ncbi:unnamed protein product [Mytilus edulis]|uniref:Uncharacterized protein n=1 Tax=Mytilus edulis TaxID=6550 RepID=A0A8S3SFK7_MYTED|nr:unnamed protein product [Mytilus edulis]
MSCEKESSRFWGLPIAMMSCEKESTGFTWGLLIAMMSCEGSGAGSWGLPIAMMRVEAGSGFDCYDEFEGGSTHPGIELLYEGEVVGSQGLPIAMMSCEEVAGSTGIADCYDEFQGLPIDMMSLAKESSVFSRELPITMMSCEKEMAGSTGDCRLLHAMMSCEGEYWVHRGMPIAMMSLRREGWIHPGIADAMMSCEGRLVHPVIADCYDEIVKESSGFTQGLQIAMMSCEGE